MTRVYFRAWFVVVKRNFILWILSWIKLCLFLSFFLNIVAFPKPKRRVFEDILIFADSRCDLNLQRQVNIAHEVLFWLRQFTINFIFLQQIPRLLNFNDFISCATVRLLRLYCFDCLAKSLRIDCFGDCLPVCLLGGWNQVIRNVWWLFEVFDFSLTRCFYSPIRDPCR